MTLAIEMRKRARTDSNHSEIREAFRKLGCSVWDTAAMGNGAPDLVVAKSHNTICVEVKDGALPPSKRKLTADEQEWMLNWHGAYAVVSDLNDVECVVKRLADATPF